MVMDTIKNAFNTVGTAYGNAVGHLPAVLGGTPAPRFPGADNPVLAARINMVPPGGVVLSGQERRLYDHVCYRLGDQAKNIPQLREKVLHLSQDLGVTTPAQFDSMNRAIGVASWTLNTVTGAAGTLIGFGLSSFQGMVAKSLYETVANDDWSPEMQQSMAYMIGASVGVVGTAWAGMGTAAVLSYFKDNGIGAKYHANNGSRYDGVLTMQFLKQALPYFSFSIAHLAGETSQHDIGAKEYLGDFDFAFKRLGQAEAAAITTTVGIALTGFDYAPTWLKSDKLIADAASAYSSWNGLCGPIGAAPVIAVKALAGWATDVLRGLPKMNQFPFWGGAASKASVANMQSLMPAIASYALAGAESLRASVQSKHGMDIEGAMRYAHQLRQIGNAALIPGYIFRQALLFNPPMTSREPSAMTQINAVNTLRDAKLPLANGVLGNGGVPGGWAWAAQAGGGHPTADLDAAAAAVNAAISAAHGNAVQVAADLPIYREFAIVKDEYHKGLAAFQNGDYAAARVHLDAMNAAAGNIQTDNAITGAGPHASQANIIATRTAYTNMINAGPTEQVRMTTAFNPQAAPTIGNATCMAHEVVLAAEAAYTALPATTALQLQLVEVHDAADKINAAETAAQALVGQINPLLANPAALAANPVQQRQLSALRNDLFKQLHIIVTEGQRLNSHPAVQGDATQGALTNALNFVKNKLDEAGPSNTLGMAKRLTQTELLNAATAVAGGAPADKVLLAQMIEARIALPAGDKKALKPAEMRDVLRPLLTTPPAQLGDAAPVVERIKYQAIGLPALIDLSQHTARLPRNNANDALKAEVLVLLGDRIGSDARRPVNVARTGERKHHTDLMRPWFDEFANLTPAHQSQVADLIKDCLRDAEATGPGFGDDMYGFFSDKALDMQVVLRAPIHTEFAAGFNGRGNN